MPLDGSKLFFQRFLVKKTNKNKRFYLEMGLKLVEVEGSETDIKIFSLKGPIIKRLDKLIKERRAGLRD